MDFQLILAWIAHFSGFNLLILCIDPHQKTFILAFLPGI